MQQTPIPYIGIAGVTTTAQAKAIGELSRSGRPVMVGILASPATLAGRPSPYLPKRYAAAADIPDIFQDDDCVLNAIHMSGCGGGKLVGHLLAAEDAARGNLDAIQLNGSRWPNAGSLLEWRETRRESRNGPPLLVLQVSREMIESVDHGPRDLVDRLQHYVGVADHILLDQSGGWGRPVNLEWARAVARELHTRAGFNRVGFGLAGGLRPDNVGHLRAFSREFGGAISVDAESGLRNPSDELDIAKVRAFVSATYAMHEEAIAEA